MHWKLQKCEVKVCNFFRLRPYFKYMQYKLTVLLKMAMLQYVFRCRYRQPSPKAIDISNIDKWCIFCQYTVNYVHPTGGWTYYFCFFRRLVSGVRHPTWFPDILGNSSYPIFTKFGMQVYYVNSLYGIACGDDSSIANWVIATLLLLSSSLVSRHFKECY